MSRIGKKPVIIPAGVEVKITDNLVEVKGPKGELSQQIRPEIGLEIKENEIILSLKTEARAYWGLSRSLIANMIEGVTKGYEKKLEIEGLGYKVALEGETIVLNVGYSHQVKIVPPAGIKFIVEKNVMTVTGINKNLVGQIAANIRKVKPPEPYKGKGIRYAGEIIKRKAGKKAVAAG